MYISENLIDNHTFETYLVSPYGEGVRNIEKCFTEQVSCLQRIKHLAVGALLLVPIINSVAMLLFQLTAPTVEMTEPEKGKAKHVRFNDDVHVIPIPKVRQPRFG